MMKIGIVTSSVSRQAGGLYEAIRKLVQSLHDSKVNCRVLGLYDSDTTKDMAGWGSTTVSAYPVKGPLSFGYAPELWPALKKLDLDLVHVHGLWMYPSVAGLRWGRHTGRPSIVSPHGMLDPWAVRNAYWKKWLSGILYQNAYLRNAACIHALCDAEANAIRNYGIYNPLCIIPNGIDMPTSIPTQDPAWLSSVRKESKILLYLGRIHPKKGLMNLLLAWAAVSKSISSSSVWTLVIAGWGQNGHEKDLKAFASQSGIVESVRFVGPQFEIEKQISYFNADAFILPSFSEGLPMTILEAWSNGLPVLMTPQCNLPEGFHAKAALRIEAIPESIEQGLRTLFAMSEYDLSLMGDRGRALVLERFAWTSVAEQMLSVYQWVLGHVSKPDCVVCD